MHSHSLTLEALDERLRQLEVTHVRKLAEAERRTRDSLAPTPDYSIGPLKPAPEACSCEESLALRAELASAQARVIELEAIVDGLRESEARSRAERQVSFEPPGVTIGTCDHCGKRAPLKTKNPGLHEKDVCAWGCEVKP